MSRSTEKSSRGRFIGEEDSPPRDKTNKRKIIPKIIIGIFAAVFIVAGVMVARYYIIAGKEQATFDELAELVGQDTDDDSDDSEPAKDDGEKLKKYEVLYTKNPDYCGWLKIGGTRINYPVMFTPNDPEYYLHRDFYGNYSESGTPFIDGGCDPDSGYMLIYGHHMNSGAIFGTLPNYADGDFIRTHSKIRFDSRKERSVYTVFAVFYSKIYPEDDNEHFQYYEYKRLDNEAIFDEYISGVKELSIYDSDITPTYGDRIIALSTCNYHTDDGRFVVVAVEKQKND